MKHPPPRYAVAAPCEQDGGCYHTLAEAETAFDRLVAQGVGEAELLDYQTEPPRVVKSHSLAREEDPGIQAGMATPFADNH